MSNENDKKETLEPVNMYVIAARLFAHVSKAVIDKYGDEARDVIRDGVRTFGEERGRDIARRAAAVGLPNEIENYLPNYDMERSDLFEYETINKEDEIEQNFTKCVFAETWQKDGMEDYGILYCDMIDPAIAKGYNKDFEVVHDKHFFKDGGCHFCFKMKKNSGK